MILVKYIINPIKYVKIYWIHALMFAITFHKAASQFILLLRLFHLFLRLLPLGVTTVASCLCHTNPLSQFTTSMNLPCGLHLQKL